jgi:nanoRNase/pAp phosphatase (c-di-AMP/oligoRNAs hydrolase)
MQTESYRLITRSDFDGLVCAVLLKEKFSIHEIKFAHPKDMQDGKIPVYGNDIIANLPYVPTAYLIFDHHVSETLRVAKQKNHIIIPDAPSAARVIYEHFGGADFFTAISDEMMQAVDKADSANFNLEEVLNPKKWVLLSFIMDGRTGLGRFKDFKISNIQLMLDLIEYCRTKNIDEILALEDVKERVELYFEQQELFRQQIHRISEVQHNVLIVNFMDEEIHYAGNRFVKYALFPQTNISIQIMWGPGKKNLVFSVGKSIFDKTSDTNIGELMLKYGGGGHAAAGTCQIPIQDFEKDLEEIVSVLKEC